MTAVEIKWQDWELILFGGFHILLDDNVLCDTVLMGCDGETQSAHSFVLAVASPVLKQQLTTSPHTYQYNVCFKSISGHVWQLILQFLYNGKIDLCNKLEADCVIKAAVELDILQLQLVAEQYLMFQQNADKSVRSGDVTHSGALTAKKENDTPEASFVSDVSGTQLATSGNNCTTFAGMGMGEDQVVMDTVVKDIVASSHVKWLTSAEGGQEAATMKMRKTLVKVETVELQQLTEDSPDEEVSTEQTMDTTTAPGCQSIDKSLETKHSRRNHKSASGEKPVTRFSRRNSKSMSGEKPASVAEDKYKCGVCPQCFPKKSQLVTHVVTHRNDSGRWPCTDCDKSYERRHELIIHRRKHTGDRPYKCSFCGSRFIRAANLRDHERIHSTEKPFKCRFCSFFSKWRTTVTNHENVTHFGLRPFKCDLCGDNFTKRVGLDKHKLLHTGEKPYVCSTCGHAFVQRCTWREHERRHWTTKPFACSICGREFVTRRSLVAHERTHTGDRPFLCAFCGSTFTTRSNLLSHQRRHTEGKTPHPCPLCPKQYAKNRTLVQHLSKVHTVTGPVNAGNYVGGNVKVNAIGDDGKVSCPHSSECFNDTLD